MRKLLRSIARYNMSREGVQKPNRRHMAINPQSGMMERMPSFFSQNWRKYAAKTACRN